MSRPDFGVSRAGLLATLVYPVLGLVLWFSLAAHLRLGLAKWPESIGVDPGTALFRLHASTTMLIVTIGAFATMAATALAAILVAIPRTRTLSFYPFIFAAGCLIAFGVMQLAPRPFIMWFRD